MDLPTAQPDAEHRLAKHGGGAGAAGGGLYLPIALSRARPKGVVESKGGVQFHPELKSKPFDPHPLFASFIEAAVKQSRLV